MRPSRLQDLPYAGPFTAFQKLHGNSRALIPKDNSHGQDSKIRQPTSKILCSACTEMMQEKLVSEGASTFDVVREIMPCPRAWGAYTSVMLNRRQVYE